MAAALLCALLAGSLALPPAARATIGSALARTLDRALSPWPALQRPAGPFPDPLRQGTAAAEGRAGGYDEAALGYALLMNGLRTGDRRQVDAALRAFRWVAGTPGAPSAFENAFAAAAYNLARERLAGDPAFDEVRPLWEEWLRSASPLRIGGQRYFNQVLVEAVAILELARTGLRSERAGTVLADPAHHRRLAAELVDARLPRLARHQETIVRGRRAILFSDPGPHPLAYHGLTLAFVARAIELLGPDASPAARRLLVRMAEGALHLAAPDGDIAYVGRSQEQAWALTLTAHGMLAAARLASARAAAYEALARRLIRRLERLHWGGPTGFALTPNLASDPAAADRGLDPYAAVPAYTGLAMIGAAWALEAAPERARRAGRGAADRSGHAVLGARQSLLATVRGRDYWFAVRAQPTGPEGGDPRLDFGLVAWKLRGPDGRWRDHLPLRPIAAGEPSAGPLLIRDGRVAVPFGRRIRVKRGGTVTVTGGGFRGPERLERRASFAFVPGRRRIALVFPVRAGDLIAYSVFLPGTDLRAVADGVASERVRVRASAPARVLMRGRYASGLEHGLVRATLLIPVRRTGTLAIVHSAGGAGAGRLAPRRGHHGAPPDYQ